MNVMSVTAVLVRPRGSWIDQFLLVVRKKKPDYQKGLLNLPGGHTRLQETPTEGGLRELKEETGIDACGLDFKHVGILASDSVRLHLFGLRLIEDPDKLQEEIDEYRKEHLYVAAEEVIVLPISCIYSKTMVPNTVYMVHAAMRVLDNWR